MPPPPRSSQILPDTFTTSNIQLCTAPFAEYLAAPDPGGVLRRGFIEEIYESAIELTTGDSINKERLQGELGDCTWYASEIARYKGIHLLRTLGSISLREFQSSHALRYDIQFTAPDGTVPTPTTHPQECLSLCALRLVDVLKPKDAILWDKDDRPQPQQVIAEMLACVATVATTNRISMDDALRSTLQKLAKRTRKTHVIADNTTTKMVDSGRSRLHPWVSKLFGQYYQQEIGNKGPDQPTKSDC